METGKTPIYIVLFFLAFAAGLVATIAISRSLTPNSQSAVETNLEQPAQTPSHRPEFPFPTVEC